METKKVSSEFYETLFHESFQALYTIDEKGDLQHINQAFCDLFSYDYNNLIGTSFQRLFEESSEYSKLIEKVVDNQHVLSEEVSLISKSGEVFLGSLSCKKIPTHLAKGGALFQGMVSDLTKNSDEKEELKFKEISRALPKTAANLDRNRSTKWRSKFKFRFETP